MSALNPSHILIARNARNQNNASASLSIPTETHAAAAGIFRSSGSPPWMLQEYEGDDLISDIGGDSDDEASIEIDETFTKYSPLAGTVKIIVESTTFWAHKEVLFFASPFFQAALSGDWAETGRPASMSSIITISQPPSVPGNHGISCTPPAMTFAPVDLEADQEEPLDDSKTTDNDDAPIIDSDTDVSESDQARARESSFNKLEGLADAGSSSQTSQNSSQSEPPTVELPAGSQFRKRQKAQGPEAVIVLKEEKASVFHDFLKFVYPHVECTITWNNVEGLMNISHKLSVPALQRQCLTFLLTHAAGRPIKAMRIAELFDEEELYREASRFVLENLNGWTEQEMSSLSQETLLKLEKRRNWFLERVLKLGLTQIAKEYQCCPTCPDSSVCARLLEEKWRQAFHAVFRFGPCQPSMVYRYLRTLEGVTPPLSLTHLSCQITAKAFAATLFDRMFSLGLRGSGLNTATLSAPTGVVPPTGPRRHFLYCSLKTESSPKPKRSKELL